jgi:hypothetical protein
MIDSKLIKRGPYGESYVALPILSVLENDRVFTVDIETEPNKVIIREACDGYFSKALDKEQFGKLIEELKLVYDQLI